MFGVSLPVKSEDTIPSLTFFSSHQTDVHDHVYDSLTCILTLPQLHEKWRVFVLCRCDSGVVLSLSERLLHLRRATKKNHWLLYSTLQKGCDVEHSCCVFCPFINDSENSDPTCFTQEESPGNGNASSLTLTEWKKKKKNASSFVALSRSRWSRCFLQVSGGPCPNLPT